jgi:arylsulfatase A-like enzyme/tetratricopeptide (TPR) repeat protein
LKRFPFGLALLLAGLGLYLGVRSSQGPRKPGDAWAGKPNIVFITIDTLRADRLGRGLTPALDGLSATGIRFLNARANVPLTLPSHVSIMTGTLPPEHGVRENGVIFQKGVEPIARTLKANGYQTAAFVGAYVLDRRFGLAEGFDTYDDKVQRDREAMGRLEAERPGADVINTALTWLGQGRTPFFLWVHLYDPHAPYTPPSDFLAKAGGNGYDGEVAYADAQAGRLLQRLRERGLAERTIIAVMGDHGEGLGDHGEHTHGMLAYDSTLRVPLIIAGPGLAPREISTPVSLADVAPSVLRLAGISSASANKPSVLQDAQQPAEAPAGKERDVYSESQYPQTAGWHPVASLAGERWKLVLSSETELYDLKDDPGESKNVAVDHDGIVLGMTTRLRAMQALRAAQPSEKTVSAEASERLRALGYASGGPVAPVAADAENPARVIDAWNRFETALTQLNQGQAKAALSSLKDLATRFPAGPVFQSTYARALMEAGHARDALAVYRAAVARWPSEAALFHELAVAARAAGQADEAQRAEQAALALDANSPAALNGLGLLHADAGRASEAAPLFERAAQADPSNASYWVNLGNARRELGSLAQAEAAYRRALDADPNHDDAANGLGVLLVQGGRPADAIQWFERALKTSPNLQEARLNLGIAFQESGQAEKAAAVYRELIAKAPVTGREARAARELLKSMGVR